MHRDLRIIIVGAGIVGSAIAYYLSKQHPQVTVIERNRFAASETTDKSFAWIHSSMQTSAMYRHLYEDAIAEYHALQEELPDLNIDWSGALSWGVPMNMEGSRVQQLNRQQIMKLEPNLNEYPDEASFAQEEGGLDPVATTNLLLQQAQENGAIVLYNTTVTSIQERDATVVGVHTSNGYLESDILVLAAGTTALISRFAAKEIIDNVQLEKLQACRLARFNKEG